MKNKSCIFLFVVVILVVAGFFVAKKVQAPNQTQNVQSTELNSDSELSSVESSRVQQQPQTVDPIGNALSRITKKPFGIFVTPKNSPVQPERFQGYHTAVDLETTPEEQDITVPVKVLCDGKLLMTKTASGYGGVAVQNCILDGKDMTIIYGHIRLSSVRAKVGDQLKAGDFLANLGTGFSEETGGERKHLHLGVHNGSSVNILGYVQNKNQLNDWLNPVAYLN